MTGYTATARPQLHNKRSQANRVAESANRRHLESPTYNVQIQTLTYLLPLHTKNKLMDSLYLEILTAWQNPKNSPYNQVLQSCQLQAYSGFPARYQQNCEQPLAKNTAHSSASTAKHILHGLSMSSAIGYEVFFGILHVLAC